MVELPEHRNISEGTTDQSCFQHPRVILTDMDGTFFDSGHRIPESTRVAYKSLLNRGVPVITTTGRGKRSTEIALKKYAPDHVHQLLPGVYHHGGVVYDTNGSILHELYLSWEVVDYISALVKKKVSEHNGDKSKLFVVYYCRDEVFTEHESEPANSFVTHWAEPPYSVLDLQNGRTTVEAMKAMGTVCTRLSILGDQSVLKQLEHNELVSDAKILCDARVTRALPFLIDIIPKGVNKLAGGKVLLKTMGFEESDVMAIGDASNDIEMLKGFWWSYAMGQAPDSVKDSARFVSRSVDDDGWSAAVRHAFPQIELNGSLN